MEKIENAPSSFLTTLHENKNTKRKDFEYKEPKQDTRNGEASGPEVSPFFPEAQCEQHRGDPSPRMSRCAIDVVYRQETVHNMG